MLIEFYINNFYTDQESKDILRNVKNNFNISSILIHHHLHKVAKHFFTKSKINTYIDYPLGTSTSYIRLKCIEDVMNTSGILSIQAPAHFLINRKYEAIRKEIREIKSIIPINTQLRFIIDYRQFNHNILQKFCSILKENQINIVYGSSGFFIDNIYDHIMATKYLEDKTNISCICNGNVWTKEHIELIIKSNIYGISTEHMRSLQLLKEQGLA